MSLNNKAILYKELSSIANGKIRYYLYNRDMKKYNSWILCCGIDSSCVLNKVWEDIVDCVAVYFQANLRLQIERSNIYIVFFLEGTIPNQLKMKIEYDRYCCRKIIINEKYPDSNVDKERIIEERIFEIKENSDIKELNSLSNWLIKSYPTLKALYEVKEKGAISIEEAFNRYYK